MLPAMVLHGGTNVWSKAASAQAYAAFHTGVRTRLVVVLAVAIIVISGRNIGRPRAIDAQTV